MIFLILALSITTLLLRMEEESKERGLHAIRAVHGKKGKEIDIRSIGNHYRGYITTAQYSNEKSLEQKTPMREYGRRGSIGCPSPWRKKTDQK